MIYTEKELNELGIKHGKEPRISNKITVHGTLEVGDYARIDDGCIFTGDVRIGSYGHQAPYCIFYGKGVIRIGDYSGFSPFSVLHSEVDDYSGDGMPGPQVPAKYRAAPFIGMIDIGNSVSAGTRVTIMPGVTVGDGVSIGAHSFINANCEPWSIYAGTPARLIRRKTGNQQRQLEEVMHIQV